MHTAIFGDWRIHYNSDFSGEAILVDKEGNETKFPAYLMLRATIGYYIAKMETYIDNAFGV